MRTQADLIAWAAAAFGLPAAASGEGWHAEPRFLSVLFDHLLMQRRIFVVREINVAQASSAVTAKLEGMEGWKQVLGFHLHRDSENGSACVRFEPLR